MIQQAVLKEHERKERMRGISLRLLINRMTAPEQALERAALQVQMAWNRVCDLVIFKQAREKGWTRTRLAQLGSPGLATPCLASADGLLLPSQAGYEKGSADPKKAPATAGPVESTRLLPETARGNVRV